MTKQLKNSSLFNKPLFKETVKIHILLYAVLLTFLKLKFTGDFNPFTIWVSLFRQKIIINSLHSRKNKIPFLFALKRLLCKISVLNNC